VCVCVWAKVYGSVHGVGYEREGSLKERRKSVVRINCTASCKVEKCSRHLRHRWGLQIYAVNTTNHPRTGAGELILMIFFSSLFRFFLYL